MRSALLFAHLGGAFLFVGGSILAAAIRVAAMRTRRASDAALLLAVVRPAVPLVAGGLLTALGAGVALALRGGWRLGAPWLVASYLLVGWLAAVGAIAGRQDRRTRELAERAGDAPEPALHRRLHDPLNLALNVSMLLAEAAIVALMVWKPGA